MSFSPFARFRNFTLNNLKALLEVYPDAAKSMEWSEAADEIEVRSPGYKKTSYQQACQFGLEDRGGNRFRIHDYLFTFDDENLTRYIRFWIKTYFAPNPYVKGNDDAILIFCEIVREILASPDHEIKYNDFFNRWIGGKSEDILLNAIKNYAEPVMVKSVSGEAVLYITESDLEETERQLNYIETSMPIGNPRDRKEFFERFSYDNFCRFYGIENQITLPQTETVVSDNAVQFHTGYQSAFARNKIVFGAPGTGKSYTLNQSKDELLGADSSNYERVTFHPNYSYAHFVGTYKPVSDKDAEGNDRIRYQYVAGPFMRIYVKALENSKDKEHIKPFLLLIEEINRANAAAVFGEIFQLLDRNGDNVSEYSIHTTEDMRTYLADKLHGAPDDYAEIRIPDNMFIWATMNSADQGVYMMDTAFKRRWEFEYIGIDDEAQGVQQYIIPVGTGDNRRYVKWNDLRVQINHILLSDDCKVNEDKLLGPFFIAKSMLDHALEDEDRFVKAFESKVIMYLFEDVMKLRPHNIFRGHAKKNGKMIFSEICKTFEQECEGVFGLEGLSQETREALE